MSVRPTKRVRHPNGKIVSKSDHSIYVIIHIFKVGFLRSK
jgi:hypothetical protein